LTIVEGASMPVIHHPKEPTHELGPTRFTSLATPSRGSDDSAIWIVEIDPGTPPTPHSMSEEEVFVILSGAATVRIGAGDREVAHEGDAVVMPAGIQFEISPHGEDVLRMVCCTRVGAMARTLDGAEFAPPWSE
jgi:quercetin dioxygenase-like cupin family protein